jgi:hypothetical protein
MIGRELSWGRVLFPIGRDKNGFVFLPMSRIPFGGLIHTLVIIAIAVWFYVMFKNGFYKVPFSMISNGCFPVVETFLTIVSVIYSLIAAKVMHFPMLEEIVESLAYFGMVIVVLRMRSVVIDKQALMTA